MSDRQNIKKWYNIIKHTTSFLIRHSCVCHFIGYIIEKRGIRLGSSGASLFGLVAKLGGLNLGGVNFQSRNRWFAQDCKRRICKNAGQHLLGYSKYTAGHSYQTLW